jgi:hypothetical protein
VAYVVLFLLLGLSRFISTRNSTLRFSLAIGLGISDFTRDRFAAASARLPFGLLLLLLLVLLVGWFGNLDNYLAIIELLLIKSLDSLLCSLCGRDSDKTVAR